jgi:hypothetical protein
MAIADMKSFFTGLLLKGLYSGLARDRSALQLFEGRGNVKGRAWLNSGRGCVTVSWGRSKNRAEVGRNAPGVQFFQWPAVFTLFHPDPSIPINITVE